MITVEVSHRQELLEIETGAVRKVVSAVLRGENVEAAEVSVAIVNDQEIHALNRRFLNHDYPTDVLSFVLEHTDDSLEGEIIVSAETALIRCEDDGWSAAEELTLYIVHGTLHLVGYEDKSSAARVTMRQREDFHLSRLGLLRPSRGGERTGSDACAGSSLGDNEQ